MSAALHLIDEVVLTLAEASVDKSYLPASIRSTAGEGSLIPMIEPFLAGFPTPAIFTRGHPRRLTDAELDAAQARIFESVKSKMKATGKYPAVLYMFSNVTRGKLAELALRSPKFGRNHTQESCGEVIVPANLFMGDERSKNQLRVLVERLGGASGCYATILATEAWMAQEPELDAARAVDPKVEVKDVPGRVETIMVALETHHRRAVLSADTIRGHSGAVRALRDHAKEAARAYRWSLVGIAGDPRPDGARGAR